MENMENVMLEEATIEAMEDASTMSVACKVAGFALLAGLVTGAGMLVYKGAKWVKNKITGKKASADTPEVIEVEAEETCEA